MSYLFTDALWLTVVKAVLTSDNEHALEQPIGSFFLFFF